MKKVKLSFVISAILAIAMVSFCAYAVLSQMSFTSITFYGFIIFGLLALFNWLRYREAKKILREIRKLTHTDWEKYREVNNLLPDFFDIHGRRTYTDY